MTPDKKAKELIKKFTKEGISLMLANQCAFIAVIEIINSNPHSNPFNTDVYSTMDYWIDVKNEIKKL